MNRVNMLDKFICWISAIVMFAFAIYSYLIGRFSFIILFCGIVLLVLPIIDSKIQKKL